MLTCQAANAFVNCLTQENLALGLASTRTRFAFRRIPPAATEAIQFRGRRRMLIPVPAALGKEGAVG